MQSRDRISKRISNRISSCATLAALLCSAVIVAAPAAHAANYTVTFLVSDQAGAAHTDARLKNAWGLAFLPSLPFWVSDNRTGLSTLYDGAGANAGTAVRIPLPPPPLRPDTDPKVSAPTGMVSNTANNFFVDGDPAWPARFMWDSEDGTIAAWFESEGGTASIQINNALNGAGCKPKPTTNCQGAVYKGLALGTSQTHGALLYATNFRSGKVEVYDDKFNPVDLGTTAFADTMIPPGYSPYGIFNLGGKLYVTYGKQDTARHDSVSCLGCGFVNVFNVDGTLVRRLIPAGMNAKLNAPWGVALAPGTFWSGGAVLVGNFGNGRINAYSKTGTFLGTLNNAATGKPIVLPDLWTIMFTGANGPAKSKPNKLYFTSGQHGEVNGRFGVIAVPP